MEFTGERVVPWSAGMRDWVHVLQHHLARYTWALGAVSGKRVVDLGSGSGYGSFLLSFVADSVLGLEIDREAVKYANTNFWAGSCSFYVSDLMVEEIPEADVYTAFEVLEHLEDPKVLLEKLKGGVLLWSLPVNDPGRFHKHVYNVEQAKDLMKPSEIFLQDPDGRIYVEDHYTSLYMPMYTLGIKRL